MSDSTAAFVLFGSIGTSLALPWSLARATDRRIEQAILNHQVFLSEKKSLEHLRLELNSESWRWPIYVRPVFYTEIDRVAQIHFSNAENTLHECEELKGHVQPPPDPPDAGLGRYHPSRNFSKILACMEIERQVEHLSQLLDAAGQAISNLRTEHRKEATLENDLRTKLQGLNDRVTQEIQASRSMTLTASARDRMDWTFNTIANALRFAEEQIALSMDDGVNFASVYIMTFLADSLLDYLTLFREGWKIPSRFEPDHFNDRLCGVEDTLKTVIRDSSLQNWSTLYLTNCLLEHSKRKAQSARRSLDDFLEKQTAFLIAEKEFLAVELPALIKEAEQLQEHCIEYWGTPREGRGLWNSALKSHPLPNMTLENVKRFHQSNVVPLIAGVIIKQSRLPGIIKNIRLMQRDVTIARSAMGMLEAELERHKQARPVVLQRLEAGGDVDTLVRQLDAIRDDTSKEIQDACIAQRQLFEQYRQRAAVVRGANYPEMIGLLDQVTLDGAVIIQRHVEAIAGLQNQGYGLASHLNRLYEEMLHLQSLRPGVEWDWENALTKIAQVIGKYNQSSTSYRELSEFSSLAWQVYQNASQDKTEIVRQRVHFDARQAYTDSLLTNFEARLQGYIDFYNVAWEWARARLSDGLGSLLQRQQSLREYWSACQNLDTIQQAVAICDSIEKDVAATLKWMEDTFSPFVEKHNNNVRLYEYYTNRALSFGIFPIPTRTSRLITTVCDYARLVPEEHDVETLFECAADLLRKGITQENVVNIENLIQDFSQRIENFNMSGGTANIASQINQFGRSDGIA